MMRVESVERVGFRFWTQFFKHGFGPAVGLVYGALSQLTMRLDVTKELYGVMSVGMVFVLPFVLGFVTVWFAEREARRSWPYRIFMPWLATALCLIVSVAVGWEGTICVVMGGV